MLILTRKVNQKIIIGDMDILICVVKIFKDMVYISIESNKEISMYRLSFKNESFNRSVKKGDCLFLNGDKIYAKIIEIYKGRPGLEDEVQIGINAPKKISIYREEIYKNIKREKQE